MSRIWVAGFMGGALMLASGAARAQDFVATARPNDGGAVEATHYLAQTASAAVPQVNAVGTAFGGYDGAAGTPLVNASAVVRVLPRLALVAGVSYGQASAADAGLRPQVGARVQLLRQALSGVDASAFLMFRQDRFTAEDGLFQGGLALGRALGETSLVLNVLYGTDGEGDDHEGEARVGVLRHVGGGFQLGAEGRYMHSLASTDPKRETVGTPTSEALAGPVATLSVSTWTMVVEAGVATREAARRETGAFAMAGVGTSF